MSNNVVTNFYPGDGVRSVEQSKQGLHTNDTGGALTLARLTILGKILAAAGAVTAGSNTGNGTCTALALADGGPAKVGTYTLTCIVAGTTHGGTFRLTDPDGIDIATIIMPDTLGGTYVYEGNGVTFTLTDGTTNFIVGDSFTFTVTAGSGYWKQYSATAKDGSNIMDAVSLSSAVHTVDGNLAINAMLTGKVETSKLIIHGSAAGVGITADVKNELRKVGIIVEDSTECSALDNQT